mmetsp:Transcript_9526/g.24301  ORF Transcript_9526/g.24301 Transcript_9526/m.24301 type:complete len:222 (+) Transcript_9526:168-833(+)
MLTGQLEILLMAIQHGQIGVTRVVFRSELDCLLVSLQCLAGSVGALHRHSQLRPDLCFLNLELTTVTLLEQLQGALKKKEPPQQTLAHHNTPVPHGTQQPDRSMPKHPAAHARHLGGPGPVQQGWSRRPTSRANLREQLGARLEPPWFRQLRAMTVLDQEVSDCMGTHQHRGPPYSLQQGTAIECRTAALAARTLQQHQPLHWHWATAAAPTQQRAHLATA